MAIKAGMVAFMKTSGEPVFVLALDEGNATVRRPNASESKGVIHEVESFTVAELETEEERTSRNIAQRTAMYEKIGQMIPAEGDSAKPIN